MFINTRKAGKSILSGKPPETELETLSFLLDNTIEEELDISLILRSFDPLIHISVFDYLSVNETFEYSDSLIFDQSQRALR